jgi:hypothetical protein
MQDRFSLTHRGMLAWLIGAAFGAAAIIFFVGASPWFLGAGIGLVVFALVAHSVRTGEWLFLGHLPSAPTWFEGWAFSTGMLFAAIAVVAQAASSAGAA